MRKFSEKLYAAVKLLFLPGVILRAFIQHVICRIFMIPVMDRKYLHTDSRIGMIEHEEISSAGKSFIFCWLHRTIADLISVPMFLVSLYQFIVLDLKFNDAFVGAENLMFFVYLLILWTAISLWCSRYPSVRDADRMWELIYSQKGMNVFARMLVFVPTLRIRIMSRAEKYGINIILALALLVWAVV